MPHGGLRPFPRVVAVYIYLSSNPKNNPLTSEVNLHPAIDLRDAGSDVLQFGHLIGSYVMQFGHVIPPEIEGSALSQTCDLAEPFGRAFAVKVVPK